MLFRKRRSGSVSRQARQHALETEGSPALFHIGFDMMMKGALLKRGRETVRQYGVTVAGSTRLVTSGDIVDRATYDALLAAGAIRRPSTEDHLQPNLPPPEGGLSPAHVQSEE